MRRFLVWTIVFLGSVGQARADGSAAWTAARRALPANPRFVMRADARATLEMPVVRSWIEGAFAQSPALTEGRERLRATCGLDPFAAVAEVVGIQDSVGGAILYFATPGLTRAAFASCMTKLGAQVADTGAIAALSKPGGGTIYLAWPAPEVIAVAMQPEKREVLEGLLGGRGLAAGSPLKKALAGVDTGAWLWGVGAVPPGSTGDVVSVRVSARRKDGKITVAVDLTSPSVEKAALAANVLAAKLGELRARSDVPSAVLRALRSVEVKVNAAEIALRATLEEDALPGLVAFTGLSTPPAPADPTLAVVQARWQKADAGFCPAGGGIKGGPFPRGGYCVDAAGVPQGPGWFAMMLQGKRIYVDVAHCAGKRCGAWTAWTEDGKRVAAWSFDAKGSDTRTFTAPGWEQFPTPPPPPPPPAPSRH